jgi:hypothetical protein
MFNNIERQWTSCHLHTCHYSELQYTFLVDPKQLLVRNVCDPITPLYIFLFMIMLIWYQTSINTRIQPTLFQIPDTSSVINSSSYEVPSTW